MSVIFEDHGRKRGFAADAPPGESIPSFFEGEGRSRRQETDPPLWGFSYDRAEGVIHLLLAFSIVGGAAALLSSGFLPGLPPAPKSEARAALTSSQLAQPADRPVESRRVEANAVETKPVETAPLPVAQAQPAEQVRTPAARAVVAAVDASQKLEPPATPPGPSALDSRPLSERAVISGKALEPLAPPPAVLREKLRPDTDSGAQAPAAPSQPPAAAAQARVETASAPEEPAAAAKARDPDVREEAKSETPARMAHCYLKLSGRVQSSGPCRVRHTDNSVILELPGKPLEIAHARGRTWTATLGGRSLGRVFRSGACWGARGFYACENG